MWSKDGISEGQDGKLIKVEGWQIVDASTKELAKATPGLPVRNQLEAVGSKYRYRNVNVTNYQGPTQWLAIAELAIPDNGTFPETPDDPLLGVMKWTPERIKVGRASETDAYRKRKINSAGDIYPPESDTYTRWRLTGRRYERFWNDTKQRKYEGKTNSNVMRLFNRTILPYECLCEAIGPASGGEYEDDPDYMLIEYVFEIGTNERVAETGPMAGISGFPHDSHYLDQGSRGWYSEGGENKQGRFCRTVGSGTGEVLVGYEDNVVLDGTGKPNLLILNTAGQPTYSGVKVANFEATKFYTPIANPTSSQHLVGGGATSAGNVQSPFSTATLPQWLYYRHQAVDFADILSLT